MGTLTDDAIVAICGGKSGWKYFSFCFVKGEMGIASHFKGKIEYLRERVLSDCIVLNIAQEDIHIFSLTFLDNLIHVTHSCICEYTFVCV